MQKGIYPATGFPRIVISLNEMFGDGTNTKSFSSAMAIFLLPVKIQKIIFTIDCVLGNFVASGVLVLLLLLPVCLRNQLLCFRVPSRTIRSYGVLPSRTVQYYPQTPSTSPSISQGEVSITKITPIFLVLKIQKLANTLFVLEKVGICLAVWIIHLHLVTKSAG